MEKPGLYTFLSRDGSGHLTLYDDKKTKKANHSEVIDLTKEDFERDVVKEMIKAGQENDHTNDRLVPVKDVKKDTKEGQPEKPKESKKPGKKKK